MDREEARRILCGDNAEANALFDLLEDYVRRGDALRELDGIANALLAALEGLLMSEESPHTETERHLAREKACKALGKADKWKSGIGGISLHSKRRLYY